MPPPNVQRFPKWMWYERFSLSYTPEKPYFVVTIYPQDDQFTLFEGYGNTIAEAAKMAKKERDESNNHRKIQSAS